MAGSKAFMLCAIIPTYNASDSLGVVLGQLSGAVDRLIVADCGSRDATLEIAIKYGAVIAAGAKGRGQQLALGAGWAGDADWLLFLHADNQLPENWRESVQAHIKRRPNCVGYFRYRADGSGLWPRIMDFGVAMRCQWWGLPYGDQGLLIPRKIYEAVGGYPAQSLFEDVALIDKISSAIGRDKLRPLKGHMRVDISRYAEKGIWTKGHENLALLRAYRRGEDVDALEKQYNS